MSTLGATFGSLALALFEVFGLEGVALWHPSALTFLPIAFYVLVLPLSA